MSVERRNESNKGQRKMFNVEVNEFNNRRVLICAFSFALVSAFVLIFITTLFTNDIIIRFVVPCGIFSVLSAVFAFIALVLKAYKEKEFFKPLAFVYILFNIGFLSYLSTISQQTLGDINFFFIAILVASYAIVTTLKEYLIFLCAEMFCLGIILYVSVQNGHPLTFMQLVELVVVVIFAFFLSRENANMRLELVRQNLRNRKAQIDPLTGLLNRRGLGEMTKTRYSNALRDGKTVGIIMLDIDHFKKYNDTFGHPQGDVCLKNVSGSVSKTVGRRGIVSRIGGEEFLVYMDGLRAEDMYGVAEAVRANVEAMRLQHATGPNDVVTISVGLYLDVPKPDQSFEAFYAKADKQLYLAKEGGRNRVVCNRKFKAI